MRRRALRGPLVRARVAGRRRARPGPWLFTHSSSEMVVASHDAVVHPTLDGWVRIDMGPYVPDLRTKSDGRIGVVVELRKTTANSTGELVQRYAAMAARPGAEERRVTSEVTGLARDAALRAAGIGLVPIGVWLVVGHRRRRELWRRLRRPDWQGEVRTAGIAVALIAAVTLLVTQPWRPDHERVSTDVWLPVQDALRRHTRAAGPPALAGPGRVADLGHAPPDRERVRQLRPQQGLLRGHQGQGAVDQGAAAPAGRRARPSRCWSATATTTSGWIPSCARWPTRPSATVVLDAGDDTSTGETWEEFSLESLDKSFDGYDHRVFIEGNHDNGSFVKRHLSSLGWTHLTGKAIDAVRRRADHRRRRPALERARQLARRDGPQLRRGARRGSATTSASSTSRATASPR